MSKPLLDLSGRIDPALIDICGAVASCAEKLQIPYLVVGAFARDLVMHYGYGAPIQRATTDIDFALQVPNWAAFEALKTELAKQGFTQTREEHRLNAPNDWHIDIVPFGGVSDDKSTIQWPPDGDVVMNVLGFQEALDHVDQVILDNQRGRQIPVASPIGMTLLKLISWTDRDPHLRNKDARDIAYLFKNYEAIPAIANELHANQALMEKYGWDITLAAAHLLGRDAKLIASSDTAATITQLLNGCHSKRTIEMLINEMSNESMRDEALLNAFHNGFGN